MAAAPNAACQSMSRFFQVGIWHIPEIRFAANNGRLRNQSGFRQAIKMRLSAHAREPMRAPLRRRDRLCAAPAEKRISRGGRFVLLDQDRAPRPLERRHDPSPLPARHHGAAPSRDACERFGRFCVGMSPEHGRGGASAQISAVAHLSVVARTGAAARPAGIRGRGRAADVARRVAFVARMSPRSHHDVTRRVAPPRPVERGRALV